MARTGVSRTELRRVQPTARRQWSDMTVAPDGFVWLEPWRPLSMQDDPMTVWVVHPATGAVDSVVIEGGAFPAGFLRTADSLPWRVTLRRTRVSCGCTRRNVRWNAGAVHACSGA